MKTLQMTTSVASPSARSHTAALRHCSTDLLARGPGSGGLAISQHSHDVVPCSCQRQLVAPHGKGGLAPLLSCAAAGR